MEELPIVAARKFERLADDPEPDLPRIAWKVQVRLQEQATPRLVTLEEIDGHLGTAEHRIRSCRRGFRVLGNDNKFIVESRSHILEEALDRGITVRVMCVAPRSIGSETLQIIDPRFPKAGDFEKSMGPVEEILRRLRDAYGGLLDFRYLRIAPAMGLFITDPDDPNHGVVKVEIYGIQPFKPLGSRPHLLLRPVSGALTLMSGQPGDRVG